MIKNVAVPPAKHSPILGQLASWQTVFSCRSSSKSATAPMRCRWGALTRNQGGLGTTEAMEIQAEGKSRRNGAPCFAMGVETLGKAVARLWFPPYQLGSVQWKDRSIL
jgi:hypothetical protein